MSRQDDIAAKAVRKSTLKCLKIKKKSRIRQLKENLEKDLQEVEILYAEDPERLKAKFAAENFAKSEKAKLRAQRKIEAEKKLIQSENSIRRLTTGEEIASSLVQGIGAALFIAATAILDTLALRGVTKYLNTTTVFYSLFGASMIAMYLFSLLQHALTNYSAKVVFNRLAHVWAFLVIGFGYSAYTITKIEGRTGWTLFGIVWGLVLTGILFYAISGRKHEKLNVILYCLAGFSGLFVMKVLFTVLSTKSFTMLILAAAFYLVGIIFYNLRKYRYMHFVGNLIMLAGSVYMFFSLFFINS